MTALALGGKVRKLVLGRLSSVVEQRFCKPLVVGSNPTAGSANKYLDNKDLKIFSTRISQGFLYIADT